MRLYANNFFGEILGTFILVFFGCGAVAVSVLFSAHTGLFQLAAVWGIAVSLAIYACRHLSCAHINPAISVAMVISKRMSLKRLPVYIAGQILGAFIAAVCIYFLFYDSITAYEGVNAILRGSPDSIKTAMMFGEYFPNPISGGIARTSVMGAMFAEGIGTFMLVLVVFLLTEECNVGRPDSSFVPVFIGLTVTAIISIIAPLTQAGINPARDFAPRLLAFFVGWGKIAIPGPKGGFFLVYILSPIMGGVLAALLFIYLLEPLLKLSIACKCDEKDNNEENK